VNTNNTDPCNDGVYCNGTDTCSGGSCAVHAGDPCVGADGDANCSESCSEATDSCTAPDPNGSVCNDGLYCNGADTCNAGACGVHAGDPCPGADGDGNCAESCNEANDTCTASDPAGSTCDDGLFCNGADTCLAGTCQTHAGDPCPGPDGDGNCAESCNEVANTCDAPDTDGSVCSDALFCNGNDTCSSGLCSVHAGDPCPGADGDGNCAESCNEGTGACNAPDANGAACTDGVFCNGVDTCSSGLCSSHVGDPCPGPDGDANCAESCNEIADTCTAADPFGATCNDGLFCNGADTCAAGTCQNHAGDPCPGADGDANCVESCNEAADNCLSADPVGSACGDQTVGECTSADTCNAVGVCLANNRPSGTACGSAVDTECTNPDTCDGAGACVVNDAVAGSPCGDAGTACVVQDTCDGGGQCVDNGFTPAATPCGNPLDSECTDPDLCDGAGVCLPNHAPAGTACGDAEGECINQDLCDGAGVCSDKGYKPFGFACGDATATPCSNPDSCSGTGTCGTNDKPDTTVCRPAVGLCDEPENCSTGTCPTDINKPLGIVCRPSVDLCDVEEVCDGETPTCPLDGFQPSSLECRPAAGGCDSAEFCPGNGPSCPLDKFRPAGFICRPAVDVCDTLEFCSGITRQCPTDVVEPAGTTCRAPAGDCDVPELCNGVNTSCPADQLKSAGTVCRASDGTCDVAETCSGASEVCPPDNDSANDGLACDDGVDCTIGDACQSGFCLHGFADNSYCDDNNVCNGDEVCHPTLDCIDGEPLRCSLCTDVINGCNPTTGCQPDPTPRVNCFDTTRSAADLRDDQFSEFRNRLRWKWAGTSTSVAALDTPFDPRDGTRFALCVYDTDEAGNAYPVASFDVPAGDSWTRAKGDALSYKERFGDPEGVTKLLLKPGRSGDLKIRLGGKGEPLDEHMPSPFVPNQQMFEAGQGVIFQLVSDSGATGVCWEKAFDQPRAVVVNSAERFKAK